MTRPTQVFLESPHCCRVRDYHPLWCNFPKASANRWFCNSHVRNPTTLQGKTPEVWASPLSLAATDGIDFSFYSTGYLDVSVRQVSLHASMYSTQEQFRNPGINARLSTSPGFSQTSTPFIAFRYQDIPRAPLVA